MTFALSDEQRRAVLEAQGNLIEFVDESTKARYVLLTEEQFQRVQSLLATEDAVISDTYAAQSEALGRAGWDDPALDVYNDYEQPARWLKSLVVGGLAAAILPAGLGVVVVRWAGAELGRVLFTVAFFAILGGVFGLLVEWWRVPTDRVKPYH